MARNYERNYEGGMGFFGALLVGALLGAAAVFFSDDRNKRRLKATIEDWKQKADDVRENVAEKAEDFRDEGLRRVSDELEKTQSKVDKRIAKK